MRVLVPSQQMSTAAGWFRSVLPALEIAARDVDADPVALLEDVGGGEGLDGEFVDLAGFQHLRRRSHANVLRLALLGQTGGRSHGHPGRELGQQLIRRDQVGHSTWDRHAHGRRGHRSPTGRAALPWRNPASKKATRRRACEYERPSAEALRPTH